MRVEVELSATEEPIEEARAWPPTTSVKKAKIRSDVFFRRPN